MSSTWSAFPSEGASRIWSMCDSGQSPLLLGLLGLTTLYQRGPYSFIALSLAHLGLG